MRVEIHKKLGYIFKIKVLFPVIFIMINPDVNLTLYNLVLTMNKMINIKLAQKNLFKHQNVKMIVYLNIIKNIIMMINIRVEHPLKLLVLRKYKLKS